MSDLKAIRVYLPPRSDRVFVATLIELSDDSIHFVRDDCKEVDYLVSGVPDEAFLESHPELRGVIIPYAGLPGKTRSLLSDYPSLELYNLHHNNEATAEMALTLLLATSKWLIPADSALRKNDWSPRYAEERPMLLSGRRALVLGMGAIGQHLAKILAAMNMQVQGMNRSGRQPDGCSIPVFSIDSLKDQLQHCDVLMVCLPSTPETEGLIGKEELSLLPKHAVIVNVGRGAIIDEEALYSALKKKRIGGAGLDVWYSYPRTEHDRPNTAPSQYPFGELDNVVMSPHRAGHVDKSEELRAQHLAALLHALARGEAITNRVDLERGY